MFNPQHLQTQILLFTGFTYPINMIVIGTWMDYGSNNNHHQKWYKIDFYFLRSVYKYTFITR